MLPKMDELSIKMFVRLNADSNNASGSMLIKKETSGSMLIVMSTRAHQGSCGVSLDAEKVRDFRDVV